MRNRVAVFCSARDLKKYETLAFETGYEIACLGYDVVYGGGYQGLMGQVAKGAESVGGRAIGFTTYHLMGSELADYNRETTHFVQTMGERKDLILSMVDSIIILPGGFGTLDELFEVLTYNQIGLGRHKIVVLDTELEPLMRQLIDLYVDRGTISPEHAELITYTQDTENLKVLL